MDVMLVMEYICGNRMCVCSSSVHGTCGISCCILLSYLCQQFIGVSSYNFKGVKERSAFWHWQMHV